MLSRTTSTHLIPRLIQVVDGGSMMARTHWVKGTRNVLSSSPTNLVTILPGVTAAPDQWLQHRTLSQYHHPHHHHHRPFTIAKMYSSGILQSYSANPASVSLWMMPTPECHIRLYSTKPPSVPPTSLDENQNETKATPRKEAEEGERVKQATTSHHTKTEEKLSIVQKFKLMYKQYWYVLIPVHIATSIVWYGAFFIAAKSGVDIIPLMEKLGAGEKILSHLQSSNAGYYAIAYAMYKIATPARYTVTVGGTTISINYLKKRGYIKPVPSSEKLKEMYEVVVVRARMLWLKMTFKRKGDHTLPRRLYQPV